MDDSPGDGGRRIDGSQAAGFGEPPCLGDRSAEDEVDSPSAVEDARGSLPGSDDQPGDRSRVAGLAMIGGFEGHPEGRGPGGRDHEGMVVGTVATREDEQRGQNPGEPVGSAVRTVSRSSGPGATVRTADLTGPGIRDAKHSGPYVAWFLPFNHWPG